MAVMCFNPRSHEGSDSEHQGTINWSQVFQSTLPRRERQQFRPKIHSNFQQKSTNYHFIYLIFPFFHPLFFLHSTSFVHILECESPAFLCVLLIRTLILSQNISSAAILQSAHFFVLSINLLLFCSTLQYNFYADNRNLYYNLKPTYQSKNGKPPMPLLTHFHRYLRSTAQLFLYATSLPINFKVSSAETV